MKDKKLKWKKCYKIDCSPPIEVFEDFVRVYKTNYDRREDLQQAIDNAKRHASTLESVLKKWNKEFPIKK